jgi:hypothetical protein
LGLLEEDELVDILSETFKKRAAEIADHAHNPQGVISSGGEFLKGLDENERQRAPLPIRPSIHPSNPPANCKIISLQNRPRICKGNPRLPLRP